MKTYYSYDPENGFRLHGKNINKAQETALEALERYNKGFLICDIENEPICWGVVEEAAYAVMKATMEPCE